MFKQNKNINRRTKTRENILERHRKMLLKNIITSSGRCHNNNRENITDNTYKD